MVDDIGFAGELGMSMNAGDLADFRVNLSRRDPNFRQLGENPNFLTTSGVSYRHDACTWSACCRRDLAS